MEIINEYYFFQYSTQMKIFLNVFYKMFTDLIFASLLIFKVLVNIKNSLQIVYHTFFSKTCRNG